MLTTIRQVRQAAAEAINIGTGLRADWLESDKIVAPVAVIIRGEYDPRFVFSGTKVVYPFKVRLFERRTAERASLERLDEYAGAHGERSIVAALQNGDLWPDGLVDYVSVTLVSEVREVTMTDGGESYLMVEIDFEVAW